MRARRGTRARAPDASAPLRAHGHARVPGTCTLAFVGQARASTPGTLARRRWTCTTSRRSGTRARRRRAVRKAGPGPGIPKPTVCVRRAWACGSPQAWRLALRWRWCAAPLRARTGLRQCPGTQHKHCLPCVCDAVCPQFDTSLLVITAGMVAGLSRQRRVGAGSDDFALLTETCSSAEDETGPNGWTRGA